MHQPVEKRTATLSEFARLQDGTGTSFTSIYEGAEVRIMGLEKYRTKSEIVYESLRKKIISGKYKPYRRLVLSKIAEEFGVSEIPTREAFNLLISEGLLVKTPHSGVVVSGLDMKDLEKVYAVRTVLEGLAARLAARNIEEKELLKLQENNRKMEEAVAKENYEKIVSLNREFHTMVYAASRNEYLQKHIFELWDLSYRIPGVFALVPEIAKVSLVQHTAIVRALGNHDEIQAEHLISNHKNTLLDALRSYPRDRPS
jgi:DNA-binding GntR family transcriptional regulator